MSTPETLGLSKALDNLWLKFLPQIKERMAILEVANHALASGNLTHELRAEAHSAAHKLAGSLGTFGLEAGTALAREAEALYAGEAEIAPATRSRLEDLASQLRSVIASRG